MKCYLFLKSPKKGFVSYNYILIWYMNCTKPAHACALYAFSVDLKSRMFNMCFSSNRTFYLLATVISESLIDKLNHYRVYSIKKVLFGGVKAIKLYLKVSF